MSFRWKKPLGTIFLAWMAAGLLTMTLQAQSEGSFENEFRVSSQTFKNDKILPISTIHNIVANNVNVCSVDGAPGGNESPELSWTGAPRNTRSFAVVAFDVTASFTHWGMYNIPGSVPGLPENAGVAGSSYGTQVYNDFFIAPEYDGPCPPNSLTPYVHRYVFTVYALDVELHSLGSANFPANAETLYQALIKAEHEHHILATAHITGLYSTNPAVQ
jgi:Raf kinase inhibitor-like YbhB/YbcL family protein